MPITFNEFVDKKQRDTIKELSVIKRMLKHGGLEVESHLHDASDDPYIYIWNPSSSPEFGLRMYKLGGDDIYYRPQKAPKKHPWGEAKSLSISEMYEDLSSDKGDKDDEKIAKEMIKSVAEEIRDYFKSQAKSLKNHNKNMSDKSPLGSVAIKSGLDVSDYSNITYSYNGGK